MNPAEEQLTKCVAEGKECDLSSFPESERKIRASLIADLISARKSVLATFKLKKAVITGRFDLKLKEIYTSIEIINSIIQDEVIFDGARMPSLSLAQSRLVKGLSANQIRLHGSMDLSNINSEGSIDLEYAQIDGDINCDNARLEKTQSNGEKEYLNFYGSHLYCKGDLSFSHTWSFDAVYARFLHIPEAKIDGNLYIRANLLGLIREREERVAIEASGIRCSGDIVIGVDDSKYKDKTTIRTSTLEGKIALYNAHIDGSIFIKNLKLSESDDDNIKYTIEVNSLVCRQDCVIKSTHCDAVNLHRSQINGSVYLDKIESSKIIANNVVCNNLFKIRNSELHDGITLVNAGLKNNLEINDTTSYSDVYLTNLKTNGDIKFNNVLLEDKSETGNFPSINADELFCEGKLEIFDCSCNSINLNYAQLDGRFELNGCKIRALTAVAFRCDYIFIYGSADVRDNLAVLQLTESTVNGSITVENINLEKIDSQRLLCEKSFSLVNVSVGSLDLSGSKIIQTAYFDKVDIEDFHFEQVKLYQLDCQGLAVNGTFNMASTETEVFKDSKDSWKNATTLLINSFHYRSIEPRVLSDRLDWLAKANRGEYFRNPYTQLARYFRNVGDRDSAKKILIMRERRQLKENMPFLTRIWLKTLGFTISFGYEPRRAVFFLLFFALLDTVIFSFNAEKFAQSNLNEKISYPVFHTNSNLQHQNQTLLSAFKMAKKSSAAAFLFSFDSLIPIVDLKVEKHWTPTSPLIAWYYRLHILLGWFFSTLAVAGMSGLVSKE